jgi:DNA-binding transcriptional MerR regulator
MPEFLLAELLAQKLEIAQAELSEFEAQGVIRSVKKNGRIYYSSRDFYRLKGVLHFMRTMGLSVDEAQDRVANWNWFTQAAAASPAK